MTSAAEQDYLKAIYALQAEPGGATTSAVAAALGVSPASATNMVKKLASLKLVRHSPYHDVQLTAAGEKQALQVIRHHRLIELYLQKALDLPWDQVHAEADKLEHVISEEVEERIAAKLGDPAVDPHGDPIPSKSGKLGSEATARLSQLAPGETAVIRRVSAQTPEYLRYLGRLGIVPNTEIKLLEQMPFGGPVRVRVGAAEHVLDENFARQIWVRRSKTRGG